jgi:hypothetical protein
LFGPKFSYYKIFDPRILKIYIVKDKNLKRDGQDVYEDLCMSRAYVDALIPAGPVSKIYRYAAMEEMYRKKPVSDYIKNKIGKYFLVYLLDSNLLRLTDTEYLQLPYISAQHKQYSRALANYQKIEKLNDLLRDLL